MASGKRSRERKTRNLQEFNYPHFHSRPCSLWKGAAGRLGSDARTLTTYGRRWTDWCPTRLGRVEDMPHIPRPPSFDHGFISFLWAVGFGAFIYFGSLAVGVSGGTAFIFAALGACAIFIFVRVAGENVPPRRQAKVKRNR